MFVRVYDKQTKQYYKSMVYCMMNETCTLYYVVLNPMTDRFEMVDYPAQSPSSGLTLVEVIQQEHAGFKEYENALLLKYKRFCREQQKPETISRLYGYPDICENFEFLTDLMENQSVPVSKYKIQIRELPDQDVWNYILTQQDADDFMRLFAGFHDALLTGIAYTAESTGPAKAVATFDNSGWYGVVELCFEGIQALHISAAMENCGNWIYDAAICVQNEAVCWMDDFIDLETDSEESAGLQKQENIDDGVSYIKALNLKWRKIG